MTLLQIPTLVRSDTVDTAVVKDTTLTIVERLKSDSSLRRLTEPEEVKSAVQRFLDQLTDPALWLGGMGILLKVILILFLAMLTIRLINRIVTRWQNQFSAFPPMHPSRQRAYTVGNLATSTARYVIWPVAGIMALSQFQIDVGALIATAGIAGLAIGFGAQTLVKDVISGVFMLFDDTLHVGDLVRIGNDVGTVEFIGVRLIKVRQYNGELMMVPAGELRTFGNRSIGFQRAIVEVVIPYEQDVDTVMSVLRRVAGEWAEAHRDVMLDAEPNVQAITEYREAGVVARIAIQVLVGSQWDAEVAIRMMLKREFDQLGIEYPIARRITYVRDQPPS